MKSLIKCISASVLKNQVCPLTCFTAAVTCFKGGSIMEKDVYKHEMFIFSRRQLVALHKLHIVEGM